MLIKLLKWSVLTIVALVALVIGAFLVMPGLHISSLQMMLNVMTGSGVDTPTDKLLSELEVEDGFYLSVFARDLGNPRFLRLDGAGRLIYSSPRDGQVLLLNDSDDDGFADDKQILMEGLSRPHGIELHNGYLYVAESNQVGRQPYDADTGELSGSYEIVVSGLTDNGGHWTKTVRIQDEWMYVAMGSTCNVCEEEDERRATIMRYRTDGTDGEIFASGLRNSVGMDFSHWDGALYATDNGRDLLGDDYPPCELNKIEQGQFYGWPYLNGDNEPDPDFGDQRKDLQADAVAPVFGFRAHTAPLGIHFSEALGKSALVALHGSWNRSTPDGYSVVKVTWDEEDNVTATDFVWGFEKDGTIIGRPVDVISDGAGGYFISDDYAQVIYRVSTEPLVAAAPQPAESDAPIEPVSFDIDIAKAAAGEELFDSMPCGSCHNRFAAGLMNLKALPQRYDLESLSDYFITPTPPMPRYEFSQEQRDQLAHYLLSRD